MDKARQDHIDEMRRLQDAINKTSSPMLKRDYGKRLKHMIRELKAYDKRRASGNRHGERCG